MKLATQAVRGDAARAPGDNGQEDDGDDPGLGDQAVAGADGVEQLRAVGDLAHGEEILRVARAGDDTAIGHARPEPDRVHVRVTRLPG